MDGYNRLFLILGIVLILVVVDLIFMVLTIKNISKLKKLKSENAEKSEIDACTKKMSSNVCVVGLITALLLKIFVFN